MTAATRQVFIALAIIVGAIIGLLGWIIDLALDEQRDTQVLALAGFGSGALALIALFLYENRRRERTSGEEGRRRGTTSVPNIVVWGAVAVMAVVSGLLIRSGSSTQLFVLGLYEGVLITLLALMVRALTRER